MGFDFNVEDELPPDDTGYGFDNIGDVLTLSPLLLEKYMQAAETIVAGAVPRVARVVQEKSIAGQRLYATAVATGDQRKADRSQFLRRGEAVRTSLQADHAGTTGLCWSSKCWASSISIRADAGWSSRWMAGKLWQKEFGWQNSKKFTFEFDEKWEAGDRTTSNST